MSIIWLLALSSAIRHVYSWTTILGYQEYVYSVTFSILGYQVGLSLFLDYLLHPELPVMSIILELVYIWQYHAGINWAQLKLSHLNILFNVLVEQNVRMAEFWLPCVDYRPKTWLRILQWWTRSYISVLHAYLCFFLLLSEMLSWPFHNWVVIHTCRFRKE